MAAAKGAHRRGHGVLLKRDIESVEPLMYQAQEVATLGESLRRSRNPMPPISARTSWCQTSAQKIDISLGRDPMLGFENPPSNIDFLTCKNISGDC